MPNAAALRHGGVASARFGPDSENDMRQAHSPQAGDVQCLGGCLWELGDCDEPYGSQMIYRNRKSQ